MNIVEQELLTLPGDMSSPPVFSEFHALSPTTLTSIDIPLPGRIEYGLA
jgi:hypothetical protein